ncbi:hypothetical protein HYW84_02875 [Candidatus Peregrinibacteria bacterium]|nr:hypothetical protein [Candidatus Peregrinibacteria bacterium]
MGNSLPSSTDRVSASQSVETARLIVRQPGKLQELTNLLETFENLNARVSERTGEDRSGDLGGAGAGSAAGSQQGTHGSSARDLAMQNIPAAEVMHNKLERHIRQETRRLEKLARTASRLSAPGSAHKLNELYAKIRRLHALIHDILDASIEVLKKLFIRVFIDQQPIL